MIRMPKTVQSRRQSFSSIPIPEHPLEARYHGPYTVESKVGEVDYIVKTLKMLKEYVDKNDDSSAKPVCSVGPSNDSSHDDNPEMEVNQSDNSDDKQHEYPMKCSVN